MKRKIKYIGIDFGSSNTEIAGVDEQGNIFVIPYNDTEEGFSSVLAENKKNIGGGDLFFSDARVRAGEDYESYDELKEDILNGCEAAAIDRVERFFARLHDTIIKNSGTVSKKGLDTFDFSEVEKVCFGHPSYYTPHVQESYCKYMKNIISRTFKVKKGNIHECPEPVLAGNAYLHIVKPDAIKKGDMLFVLDFGGHTMDLVLLKVDTVENQKGEKVTGLVQITVPGSFYQCIPMGKDITTQLCMRIYKTNHPPFDYSVELKKCEFFASYDRHNASGYVQGAIKYPDRLQRWGNPAERPKYFRIESKNTGPLSNSGDGKIGHVGVFDDIAFDSTMTRIVEVINGYLEDAGIEDYQINHVLFSGGMSKISLLRERIVMGLSDSATSGNTFTQFAMDENRQDRDLIKSAFYDDSFHLSSANAVAIGAALEAAGLIVCNRANTRGRKQDNQKIQKLQNDVAYLEKKVKTMENCNYIATRARRDAEKNLEYVQSKLEAQYPAIAAELFRKNDGGNGSAR